MFRTLSRAGVEDWRALRASSLFERFAADGRLVGTEELDRSAVPETIPMDGWAAVLAHQPIPFVSYPYEWTFGMLRDAALLHLELMDAALQEGLILKDASAYNVQWRGTEPVFIDIGSFERHRPAEPWVGYRQFCMLFLNPLLMQAYKDLPFHPWLRGSIDGVTPAEAKQLLAGARLRRGVMSHITLHSRVEQRYSEVRGQGVKREMRKAGFDAELIRANVKRLTKLVRNLEWKTPRTAWTGYGEDNTYTDADADVKARFVRTTAERTQRRLVWDLGCNDGTYARIAAEAADYVVAVDSDHSTVEHLYRELKQEGQDRVVPLVMSVSDPSPGLGWRGLERRTMPDRGKPDLVLCLALLHHVAITDNVPVRQFVYWLRGLECRVILEFISREDPMTQRLLSAKREGSHPDYERESFERVLHEVFDVERSERLPSGTRTLYDVHPRA